MPDRRATIARELVVRAGLLTEATPARIAGLVALTREVVIGPGDELYPRDAPAHRFFVITSGQVELTDVDPDVGESQILRPGLRFSNGDAVGLIDAILDRPYACAAVAVDEVHALAIRISDYLDFLADNVDLAMSLIMRFASALDVQLRALPAPERMLGAPGPALLDLGARTATAVDRLLVLRATPAFARASVQAQVSLAGDARVVRLAMGDTLFRAGAPTDTVWIVATGAITVTDAAGRQLRCGPGHLVEPHAALAGGPRRGTATAATETIVLGLDRDVLDDRLEEHVDLVRSLLAFLASEQDRMPRPQVSLRLPTVQP